MRAHDFGRLKLWNLHKLRRAHDQTGAHESTSVKKRRKHTEPGQSFIITQDIEMLFEVVRQR